jgi:cyclohexyl-isocyanide hydratase
MDVAAPVELFSWMKANWTERTVTVSLAAESFVQIRTRDGLRLTPDRKFSEYHRSDGYQANLIWVPGGEPSSLNVLMKGGPFLDFLKEQSEKADYTCSVCEGAMLLAAAGLLNGYEATTHWAFLPCFKSFPEIKVAAGFPRYIIDRNRVTGGGISSGLDEVLAVIALVAGEDVARQAQLTTQYYPNPPFWGEIPVVETCPLSI